jgi:polysaccharide export outer membrane protein
MIRKRKAFLTVITLAVFTFFSILPPAAVAQQGKDQIQLLVKSGVLTRQQVRLLKDALEGERICMEALKRVREEGGTLAQDELEACKRMQRVKEALEGDEGCLKGLKRVEEKGGILTEAEVEACKGVVERIEKKQEEEPRLEVEEKVVEPGDQEICLEALKRVQKEGGTLIPEELEACERMPEVIREEMEKKAELEEVRKAEEEALKEQPKEPPVEEERDALKIFGHELFTRAPSTFAPVKAIPVSNDYIIGPGDEIKILMWGRMDAEYSLEVDSEGVINIPEIGPMVVIGMTYGELKAQIKRKVEAITGVNVHVSMGRLRTIQVFVLGEVRSPGLYTVSSLATIGNALLVSGGPTKLGSLRRIELKRKGKTISTIDGYDFLLKGDISRDIRLMPGDVIFVPQVGPMVWVSGNVRRAAIYELKDDRSLQTALQLAGGLAPQAYNQRIQIERYSRHEIQVVLDITYEELEKRKPISVQDGDLIRVFPILPTSVNAVYLYGNVLRPGQYAYKSGSRLLDIVPDLKSLEVDTYLDYALIKRYRRTDMKTELIPFDLGKLLLYGDESQNLPLQPLDEIYVFSRWMFEEKPSASIEGEVRKPGTYVIDKMKVKDLIFKAGGLTRDAYMNLGHVYRTHPTTKEMTIHAFNVGRALKEDPEQNLPLKDMDQVVIHSVWQYVQKYDVTIKGEVNKPDDYPYATNMTIRDLILLGGNVKDSAYLEKGELVRFQVIEGKEVQTSLINFNVRLALQGDPRHNLKLKPLDVVHIKQIPEWAEARTVIVTGEVNFPGSYEIRRDERLSSVIERAGGFTDGAYFRGAVFTRESVREIQQKRLDDMMEKLRVEIARASSKEVQAALSKEDLAQQQQFITAQQGLLTRLGRIKASGRVVIALTPLPVFKQSGNDMILEDGDELHVPQKPDTVNVLGEVYNPTSLVFEEDNPTVGYYLAKTGGPTENAEKGQIYVIRADGTVVSKKGSGSWLSGFDRTKLYPGDTILVPQKIIYPNYMATAKDLTQILYQIAVGAAVTIAALNAL